MPFKSEYVEPEEFMEYRGKSIYHTYDNEDYNDRLFYHYSTSNCEDETKNGTTNHDFYTFDIRDIAIELEELRKILGFDDSEEGHKEVLIKAIENRILKFPPFNTCKED